MYRTVIELKEDTPNEVAKEIRQFCIKAHKNRAGQVQIKDISEKSFVFEGDEKDFACLNLGFLELNRIDLFKENVERWFWEDEEPTESCDLMEALSKRIYA